MIDAINSANSVNPRNIAPVATPKSAPQPAAAKSLDTATKSPDAAPTSPAAGNAFGATSSVDTGDTVRISLSAQVKNLKAQGQTISQIANQLGLDAKTVAGYLGVQSPTVQA